jgi:3-deoxy-7-phosphoheptulonate synthase
MSSYSETDAYDNLLLHTDGSKRGEWTPNSWRQYPIKQQPEYPDEKALEATLKQVRSLPPLVHAKEVDSLKAQLAAVCRGERFILQAPDSR